MLRRLIDHTSTNEQAASRTPSQPNTGSADVSSAARENAGRMPALQGLGNVEFHATNPVARGSEPVALRVLTRTLLQHGALTPMDAAAAMRALLDGADAVSAAAFLTALRARGIQEGMLDAMLAELRARAVDPGLPDGLLDTCGTGGDGAGTVNISTGAALLAAACGARVAKHGNRAVSGRCGSADVLEALGIATAATIEQNRACLETAGFTFLLAPRYHPALRALAPLRQALGFPTVFNLLGPLANPAPVRFHLLGVHHPALLDVMARVLQSRGVRRALVVHGSGVDELTPLGVCEAREVLADGRIAARRIDPTAFQIPPCRLNDLRGGTAADNAAILRRAFAGETGPVADTLALNAGFALHLCGIAETPGDGIAAARQALTDGRVAGVVERLAEVNRTVPEGALS